MRSAAQSAEDRVREATDRAKAGDFVGAAAKFREAYALQPKPEYMCNVGVAYHKAADELPRAQRYLSECVQLGKNTLDKAFLAAVSAELDKVEARLAKEKFTPISVQVVPPTTTVSAFGPDETFVGSRVIWLPWGTHAIKFTAEGYGEKSTEVTAEGHAVIKVVEMLEKKPIDVGSGSDAGSGSATGAGSGSASVEKTTTRIVYDKPRSKIPAIAATAVTVAATVIAAVAIRSADRHADLARRAIEESTFVRDRDIADRQNRLLVVSGGVAVIAAAASGFLWFRAMSKPSARVEIVPADGGASVSVSGRF